MTWQELGDGVWVRRFASLDLNIGVVAGGEGLLVIDTRAGPGQARELKDDIRRLSSQPVRFVVNTHHHWDHTFGNQEFRDSPIWGHRRCAEQLVTNGPAMKAFVGSIAQEMGERVGAVEIVPPDRLFDTSTTVLIGDRAVELRFLGRGHTDNDIVALVPDAGVLFAGDLLENDAPPNFGDSFPMDWPHTAAELLDLVTGPVVPGHGSVADRDFVEAQVADLVMVSRLARQRHEAGIAARYAAHQGGPFPPATLAEAFERAYAQLDTRLL
jgi:glyoxylase-like metal-dependent hydrolase (beta-lactamase superfamily II)